MGAVGKHTGLPRLSEIYLAMHAPREHTKALDQQASAQGDLPQSDEFLLLLHAPHELMRALGRWALESKAACRN